MIQPLVRLWRPPVAPGKRNAVGLYRAESKAQLDGLLGALPLSGWMQITVTPLERHPNDPTTTRPPAFHLPLPCLRPVYRLDATLGEPLDLGDQIETATPELDWLNKGVFISVAGRLAAGVIYETYLVG